VGLFAHAALVEKAGFPATWNDLTHRYRLLLGDRDLTIERALDAAGLSVPSHARQLRSDDELTQLAALRAGLGAGVCQVPIARRDPTLVRLLPDLPFPMPVWVVRHEDQRPVHRVSLVFDALVEGLLRWMNDEQE
jgi:DNA-binding transcriptional LysR family regulator